MQYKKTDRAAHLTYESAFNTDLHHGVSHKIILKPLQLKLKNRRKVNKQDTLLSILQET